MSEAATAIASAVEKQGAATAEIARNVSEAAKGTGEVTTNIAGISTAAQSAGVAASEVLNSATDLSQNGEALKTQARPSCSKCGPRDPHAHCNRGAC